MRCTPRATGWTASWTASSTIPGAAPSIRRATCPAARRARTGPPVSPRDRRARFSRSMAAWGGAGRLVGAGGAASRQLQCAESFTRYMAFGKADPTFDWKTFDFDKDPGRMGEIRRMLNATDPDLSAFRKRGGKLLMYFGWADTALTPLM